MKLISVSSLLYYVTDPAKTQEFYETLGFHFDKNTDRVVTFLNWFSIELRQATEPIDANCGEHVYIKVDSLEELEKRLIAHGIQPKDGPKEAGKGIRELQVRDPDGYKLTFFEKK